MKVVQQHTVVKKYVRVGKLKPGSMVRVDSSVSLNDRGKYDLLGFVVCFDLNAEGEAGDCLEFSVESFFALEANDAPTVQELWEIVDGHREASLNTIIAGGGVSFLRAVQLNEDEIRKALKEEIDSLYTANPLLN